MPELNDFEVMALLAGMISSAFVVIIAVCICHHFDKRTEARIWQDKRNLSRIDML